MFFSAEFLVRATSQSISSCGGALARGTRNSCALLDRLREEHVTERVRGRVPRQSGLPGGALTDKLHPICDSSLALPVTALHGASPGKRASLCDDGREDARQVAGQ